MPSVTRKNELYCNKKIWSLGLNPMPDNRNYNIIYGFGYCKYIHKSDGIEQTLEMFVPTKDSCKVQILTLNNKKLCPNCSAEIALDAMFCPECGKEQEKVEPKPEILPKGKKRCTGCKEIIDDKVSFCPLCGAEQKEEPQDNENKENTKEQIEEKNDEDK